MTSAHSPYRTTYHRDHSVTLWDVYTQSWQRTSDPSDEMLAAMEPADRRRVCRHILANRSAESVSGIDDILRESADALDAYCAI